MTYIASVRAKNGVALIADSLVTTMESVLEERDYINLLADKRKRLKKGEKITLNVEDVAVLFKSVPAYTTDYEEKLFEYDRYTAIMTAGSAVINGLRISELISNIRDRNKRNKKNYNKYKIRTKVKRFCDEIEKEVRKHIKKYDYFSGASFIVSNYNPSAKKTTVFNVYVNQNSKASIKKKDAEVISFINAYDWEKVVCDGQNKSSNGLLYGEYFNVKMAVKGLINTLIEEHGLKISEEEKDKIIEKSIPNGSKDIKMFKIKKLSLQQAVDLANLLMHVELDIQKYTENIPTVGGVIKMAIIDENGFKFISGNEIITPKAL